MVAAPFRPAHLGHRLKTSRVQYVKILSIISTPNRSFAYSQNPQSDECKLSRTQSFNNREHRYNMWQSYRRFSLTSWSFNRFAKSGNNNHKENNASPSTRCMLGPSTILKSKNIWQIYTWQDLIMINSSNMMKKSACNWETTYIMQQICHRQLERSKATFVGTPTALGVCQDSRQWQSIPMNEWILSWVIKHGNRLKTNWGNKRGQPYTSQRKAASPPERQANECSPLEHYEKSTED